MDPLSDSVVKVYSTTSDWMRLKQKHERQEQFARVGFFIIGLLLIGYMMWYGHQTDNALKIMNSANQAADQTTLQNNTNLL